jgi:hypothetical protein
MHALLDEHFDPYSQCKPSTDLWIALEESKVQKELLLKDNPELEWEYRPWQLHLIEKIRNPKAREIIFVVDTAGDAGKSCLIPRLEHDHPEWPLWETTPGKKADLAYALRLHFPRPRIIYMDCPREMLDYIPYNFLELCKTGKVQSTKYVPSMVYTYGAKGTVVCCMNEFPDITKLSKNRYYVMHIENPEAEPVIYTKDTGFPDELFAPSGCQEEEVYEPRIGRRKRARVANGQDPTVTSVLLQLAQNLNDEAEYKKRRRTVGNRPLIAGDVSEDIPQPRARADRVDPYAPSREVERRPLAVVEKKKALSKKLAPPLSVARLPVTPRKKASFVTPATTSPGNRARRTTTTVELGDFHDDQSTVLEEEEEEAVDMDPAGHVDSNWHKYLNAPLSP